MKLLNALFLTLTLTCATVHAHDVVVQETTTYKMSHLAPSGAQIITSVAAVSAGIIVAAHNPILGEFFIRCSLEMLRGAPVLLKNTTTVVVRR